MSPIAFASWIGSHGNFCWGILGDAPLSHPAAARELPRGFKLTQFSRIAGVGDQEYVYGVTGSKLAVMNGQSLVLADIPLPGGAEAVFNSSGLSYFRHADMLGSARLASDPGGHALSSDRYSPYGYDLTGAGAGYRSFTGAKQDIDSSHSGGQYDFLAREYNSIQGRWWTPDPAGLAAVDPANLQSWNRYAYVNGNPLSATDLTGLCGNLVVGGSTQAAGTADTVQQSMFAAEIGAQAIYPFAGENLPESVVSIEGGTFGFGSAVSQTRAAIAALAAGGPGGFTLYGFSGGAQMIQTALGQLGSAIASRATVVGVSPGYGLDAMQFPYSALTV